ncbi:MAG: tetratricopeptide repeat protein [Helicobacteraceae bacterium]|jgi:tetratricopeptide (TPR) repeat protein|nr:tetratricopeptide repeat protein [Helicobacteraceae bacterium]
MRAFVLLSLICALAFAEVKSYAKILDISKIGDEAKELMAKGEVADSPYMSGILDENFLLKARVAITKEIQTYIASRAIVKHNALNAKDIAALTKGVLVVVYAQEIEGSHGGHKVQVEYTLESDIANWVDKINLKNQSDILTKKSTAQGGYDAAQNKIKAIEHFNNAPKCFFNDDDCDHKDYTAAVEEFTKAVALSPDLKEAYRLRGDIYAELGAYKKAIADYDRAIKLDDGYIRAYAKRGDAYYHIGAYKKAIADYDRAIELEPDNETTYETRANAYRNIGEYKKAIADYDQTLKLNPEYPVASNARWVVINCANEDNIKINNNERAFAYAKEKLNPNNAESYYNVGDLYRKDGTLHYGETEARNYLQALAYYAQAIKIDPDYIDAHIQTGSIYSDIGFYDKAIVYYGKALKIDSNNTRAYAERGFAYMKSGDYEKALADYNQTIKIDPDYAYAYFLRANAYRDLGEYEKAIDNYAQSIVIESGKYNRNESSLEYRDNLNLALKLIDQEKLLMNQPSAKAGKKRDR